jgi:hypothetical protein
MLPIQLEWKMQPWCTAFIDWYGVFWTFCLIKQIQTMIPPRLQALANAPCHSHCLIKMYHVLYYVASFPCLCMYNFL